MAFVLVLSVLLTAVHVYLWRRLVRDTALTGLARVSATVALCLLAPGVPVTFLVWMESSRDAGAMLPPIAFSWLGVMFYLWLGLVAWDAVRVGRALWRKGVRDEARATPEGPTPLARQPSADFGADTAAPAAATLERQTRRVFIARSAASTALIAASGVSALGVRSALYDITTPEVSVGLSRLPRALDGYGVALLSDIHIGPTLDGRFLRRVVQQTNRLRPDLIAIVGDLVDGSVSRLGGHVAELRHLRARHGVYFVTGNHEYYSGAEAWMAFLRTLGIRVLVNEHLSIGDAGASFDLAGIPDLRARGRDSVGPNAARAVRGRDPERELVMLAHQPVQIASSLEVDAGLQLSGHTHGGQLYPFGALTLMAQPYLAGLHQHPDAQTQIYVSRGTGFWGPPMRVLAPSEISHLRLHRV